MSFLAEKTSKKRKADFSGKVFLSIEQKIRCAIVCDAKVVECGICYCFTKRILGKEVRLKRLGLLRCHHSCCWGNVRGY
jgi:hypothetical protein